MVEVQLDHDLKLAPAHFLYLVGRFVNLAHWVGEARMQGEGDLLDEVAEILIVDASHVADPLMRVAVSLLAHREGQRAVNVGKHYLLSLRVLFLFLHHRPQLISNISKATPAILSLTHYHSLSNGWNCTSLIEALKCCWKARADQKRRKFLLSMLGSIRVASCSKGWSWTSYHPMLAKPIFPTCFSRILSISSLTLSSLLAFSAPRSIRNRSSTLNCVFLLAALGSSNL